VQAQNIQDEFKQKHICSPLERSGDSDVIHATTDLTCNSNNENSNNTIYVVKPPRGCWLHRGPCFTPGVALTCPGTICADDIHGKFWADSTCLKGILTESQRLFGREMTMEDRPEPGLHYTVKLGK
jgi:hypothetical protein